MLQEWKLNIDAAEYERNIYANLHKSFEKNKINRNNRENYWPTSIKKTIWWFPLIAIMEHTANIMDNNNGLISSSLKVFIMFELRLSSREVKLDAYI